MPRKFQIFNKVSGNLVFEGSAKECCERLHCADSTLRISAKEDWSIRGTYKIVEIIEPKTDDIEEELTKAEDRSAAASWDAFCEPIRKKFGIPVYKAKPEVRG
jgi:hypothetical protein